jgi:hypothetical protein
MFKIRTNVANENGAMRAAVRNALRAEITKVQIVIQDEIIELEKKEGGEWFAPIAIGEDDKMVNAKVDLALTIAEYTAPKPRTPKAKEAEKIVIEKE